MTAGDDTGDRGLEIIEISGSESHSRESRTTVFPLSRFFDEFDGPATVTGGLLVAIPRVR